MTSLYSRRRLMTMMGAAALGSSVRLSGAAGKSMRGAFIIMATPYTDAKEADYEDLAGEVDFLDRCGVQGMVWPQFASEYPNLKKEERFQGMETLAKAAKGKKPAMVLGVQAANIDEMLEFARRAEKLEPDALIAMPPKEAKSLDDYRAYYGALCKLAKRGALPTSSRRSSSLSRWRSSIPTSATSKRSSSRWFLASLSYQSIGPK